jgi:glyoxylase-like metal-dependent hydrolase (beta-lactamase superfamily II)
MNLTAHALTFNPFEENTYLISAPSGECIIIDPGCFIRAEQNELVKAIEDLGLTPVKLINTHCHIDHVLGNSFVAKKYELKLEIHQGELKVLRAQPNIAGMYGVPYDPSPEPEVFLEAGDEVVLDGHPLRVLAQVSRAVFDAWSV